MISHFAIYNKCYDWISSEHPTDDPYPQLRRPKWLIFHAASSSDRRKAQLAVGKTDGGAPKTQLAGLFLTPLPAGPIPAPSPNPKPVPSATGQPALTPPTSQVVQMLMIDKSGSNVNAVNFL
jgi:hypothetical protein